MLTLLLDSPCCGLNNFFLKKNNECAGVINVFFVFLSKKYNCESKSQYLHIIIKKS